MGWMTLLHLDGGEPAADMSFIDVILYIIYISFSFVYMHSELDTVEFSFPTFSL